MLLAQHQSLRSDPDMPSVREANRSISTSGLTSSSKWGGGGGVIRTREGGGGGMKVKLGGVTSFIFS